MRKSIALLVIILLLGLLLNSCTSYPKPLYNRLSNPEYYDEFSMIIRGFEYSDVDTNQIEEYTPDISEERIHQIYIVVSCDSRETFINFFGGISEDTTDEKISEEHIYLQLCKENNDILISGNFYDELSVGDNITVSATHFVYFDVGRNYVCSIKTENKTYLDFDEGLSNIVKMMDNENQK